MHDLARIHDVSAEQTDARIAVALNAHRGIYKFIVVRSVAARIGADWCSVLTVIIASPMDLALRPPQQLRYRDVRLLESVRPIAQLTPVLDEIRGGHLTMQEETLSFPTVSERSFRGWQQFPSGNSYFRSAGLVFEMGRGGTHTSWPSGPLLDYELPYHSDIYSACAEWSLLTTFNGSSDSRLGGVVLLLPELRARMGQPSLYVPPEDDKVFVVVPVEGAALAPQLRVKGAWLGSPPPAVPARVDETPQEGACRFLVPDKPTARLEVFLIDDTGYVFDGNDIYLEELLRAASPSPAAAVGTLVDLVRECLALGEGPTVEFKPFVRNGDAKRGELFQSIMSFANTRGGTLVLGVDKHCRVIGVQADLVKQAQHAKAPNMDPECLADEYLRDLKKELGDLLNRSILVSFEQVVFDGHRILVVSVPAGPEPPYFHIHAKDVHVRRGSNNVRADPDHDWTRLLERKDRGLGGEVNGVYSDSD